MRESFLGSWINTVPKPGSLRRIFHDDHEEFGLKDTIKNYNVVHLASNVLETLLETKLLFSLDYNDQETGRYLLGHGITAEELDWLVFCPIVLYKGRYCSVFQHTACMDIETSTATIMGIISRRREGHDSSAGTL